MKRLLASWCIYLLSIQLLLAQIPVKKPLDHQSYDSWQSIRGDRISNNGQWVIFEVAPQEGDGYLVISHPQTDYKLTIPRGTHGKISEDSEFAVFTIKPAFADIRQAKIKKKKKDDMPKDSLGIVWLEHKQVVKIPRVKSYKLPEKGPGVLAYHQEKALQLVAIDISLPKDSTKSHKSSRVDDGDLEDIKIEEMKEEGADLVLRNLKTGAETRFHHVTDYSFSKNGKKLIFITSGKPKDTTAVAGVFLVDTETFSRKTLLQGKGKYKQATLDETGSQVAFLADRDTMKAKRRFYNLYYWNNTCTSANIIADTLTRGMPSEWMVSEHGKVFFSQNGERLFFTTAPVMPLPDTTVIDFEMATLDIWNWRDPFLQSQQLKTKDEDQKKSYLAIITPHNKTQGLIQLATEVMPQVTLTDGSNAAVALGISTQAYRHFLAWEGYPEYQDIFVIDVATGEKKKVKEKLRAEVRISPKGKFIYWYDSKEKAWFSYAINTGVTLNLTEKISSNFFNEENDMPEEPASYGIAGWTESDKSLLVYDKYDIWQLDPTLQLPAQNITAGLGRKQSITYRYIQTNPDEKFIKPGSNLLLRTFHTLNKKSGFASLNLSTGKAPKQLVLADYLFSFEGKAKNDDKFLFSKSSFSENPDLYISNGDFGKTTKLSSINPQQKDYLWGSAELVTWTSAEGKPLEGILYKPENFDSTRRYPMLVYFYERSSDQLHTYFSPAPSASTINRPFFTSRGYLVFVPDITYQIGYPGKSAEDAIIPGVQRLIERGFVDSKNIGIQGQSWGGYQVTYLITRTNLFKAAMAGAPVANMTSAYGGIRWESGMSRMFQYEKTQSRIGGTLWEKPSLYIENSPLFRANFVETPLLMMHNDNDGAVPWYQSIEMFLALRRLEKPVWMLTYNREAHNLVERRNRKDLSIRMQQFFDHYLKGEPEPKWMKHGIPALEKGKQWGYELTEEEQGATSKEQ